VGGGGSLLAVPLMVYVVGVASPHVAIGTSALAVAANAASSLVAHARAHNVKWRCSLVFAVAGLAGAWGGSTLGKAVPGEHLLALFAVVMLVVAVLMLRRRGAEGDPATRLDRENAPRLVGFGLATGLLSGFFGIGGGFIIVPALIAATGMPILNAVGSSLVAVTAFGVATAANYALSGWVDPVLAATFIVGGAAGGPLGSRLARSLAARRGALNGVLGGVIIVVALYVLYRSVASR
jgi:uncharacterized membrane protein YfcA